jgi:hypothetical protein
MIVVMSRVSLLICKRVYALRPNGTAVMIGKEDQGCMKALHPINRVAAARKEQKGT